MTSARFVDGRRARTSGIALAVVAFGATVLLASRDGGDERAGAPTNPADVAPVQDTDVALQVLHEYGLCRHECRLTSDGATAVVRSTRWGPHAQGALSACSLLLALGYPRAEAWGDPTESWHLLAEGPHAGGGCWGLPEGTPAPG